jgi:hypothetical protein
MPNFNPGDIIINKVMLEGKDYSQNMVNMVFHEHILSPMMKGFVQLSQYTGSQNNFDGSKPSNISFNTPSGQQITYNLVTNGIKNVLNMSDRARNFTVDLVSPHAIMNNATPNYQKSFKNKQISDVIRSILTEGLGMKIPMNITDTKGLHGSDNQSIILTQKSPLRHIEDLRKMAISNQNFDGFLMFAGIGASGKEEFNFQTIYDLIKGSVVAEITNLSHFEINSNVSNSIMNNVIEQWLPQQTDAMAKGSAFSTGATMFDINKATAMIQQVTSGLARQKDISSTSLNPGKTSGFVTDPHNGLASTSNVVLEDSRRPSSSKATTGPYTQSLMADMMQNYMTIKIPGNSNLRLGQIVNYGYRENTDTFLNKDTKFYGKNMVTGITHYIGSLNDSPRYVTYIDTVNVQTYNGKIA